MKQNAQYYADLVEGCLARANEIEPTIATMTLKIAARVALLAEAQVYATLAVAAAQDKQR